MGQVAAPLKLKTLNDSPYTKFVMQHKHLTFRHNKIETYTPPTATLVEVTVERGFAVSLPDDVVNPW